MSVVPNSKIGKVEFYETHNTPWSTNAVAIGSSASEITALATKTAAARAAFNAQQAAQSAAKAATLTFDEAVTAMAQAGSDVIKKIRAKAATSGNSVYALAEIPAPATPAPIAAPGTPSDFKVTLNPDGSLKLAWKCVNPAGAQGTIYQVSRRVGSTGAFVTIGGSGKKAFTDDTLPSGAASVTYKIVAVRSTAIGIAQTFSVNFGVSGGEMVATIAGAARIAA